MARSKRKATHDSHENEKYEIQKEKRCPGPSTATIAHPVPDLADHGREGEHDRFAHPHEHTRDPLNDHPRPASPRCYRLPLMPHRHRAHTAAATPFSPPGPAATTLTMSRCCCPAIAITPLLPHADATTPRLPGRRHHIAAAAKLPARRGRPEALAALAQSLRGLAIVQEEHISPGPLPPPSPSCQCRGVSL